MGSEEKLMKHDEETENSNSEGAEGASEGAQLMLNFDGGLSHSSVSSHSNSTFRNSNSKSKIDNYNYSKDGETQGVVPAMIAGVALVVAASALAAFSLRKRKSPSAILEQAGSLTPDLESL